MNRLGALRSDHDIFQTFEGDNTVGGRAAAGAVPQGWSDPLGIGPCRSGWFVLWDSLRPRLKA